MATLPGRGVDLSVRRSPRVGADLSIVTERDAAISIRAARPWPVGLERDAMPDQAHAARRFGRDSDLRQAL